MQLLQPAAERTVGGVDEDLEGRRQRGGVLEALVLPRQLVAAGQAGWEEDGTLSC